MFYWELEYSFETKAKPSEIWKFWCDVEGWPLWDNELEWCTLEGNFETGSKGQLKPKNWQVTPFTLTHVEPYKSFSDSTDMPFTRMEFFHTISPTSHGSFKVSHQVKVKGLLAPILKRTVGKKIIRGMPIAMQKLKALVEHGI